MKKDKLIEEAKRIFLNYLIKVDKTKDVKKSYLPEYYKYELEALDKALTSSTKEIEELKKANTELLEMKFFKDMDKYDKQTKELKNKVKTLENKLFERKRVYGLLKSQLQTQRR